MSSYHTDNDHLSPSSSELTHDQSSSPSSGVLITPTDEISTLSYARFNTPDKTISTTANGDNTRRETNQRIFRTTALDALEQDIYLRRQQSLEESLSAELWETRRNGAHSLDISYAPTPPPKDSFYSPDSQLSGSDSPRHIKGNHRRTRSARELIKVFEEKDSQLLPSENDYSRSRNNNIRSPASASSTSSSSRPNPRPRSAQSAQLRREPPVPQTPPRQFRLLSPHPFPSPRRKSKPLDRLGGTSVGSSVSLNSMMASVLSPSGSSGSTGGMATVKNSFQSLLGVFSPARRKKKRSVEELSEVAEEGFVVDRTGKGIALSKSSVSDDLVLERKNTHSTIDLLVSLLIKMRGVRPVSTHEIRHSSTSLSEQVILDSMHSCPRSAISHSDSETCRISQSITCD